MYVCVCVCLRGYPVGAGTPWVWSACGRGGSWV